VVEPGELFFLGCSTVAARTYLMILLIDSEKQDRLSIATRRIFREAASFQRGHLDTHPLVREYCEQLRSRRTEAWTDSCDICGLTSKKV
jgi:hypothetical protein